MTTKKSKREEKVYGRIKAGLDLEYHVKVDRFADVTFLSLREYIPSLGKYGRGVSFPIWLLTPIIAAMSEAQMGEQ